MPYEEIMVEVADRVATLTLNRPTKLNAWTPKMESEVQDALLSMNRDEAVRAIIITGAGRGFCAGADMQGLSNVAGSGQSFEQIEHALRVRFAGPRMADAKLDFRRTYSYLMALSKPVVAAINGATAGLGMVIALYCDVRFASDQAKFTTAFARRGLIAEHGMSWLLPRLVGMSNALDLLMSARLVDAQEALRMGLVNRVFSPDELMAEARKYATDLANNVSPRSMRVIKRQVYNTLTQSLAEAIDEANDEMLLSFRSDDFKEGVAHFVEKRSPNFPGR